MHKPTKKLQQRKKEIRATLGSKLEVREQKDGSKKLAGYAVVFNSPANIGSFSEIIAPGSFTQTLREDDQVMLRDHQSELLLARRSAGTLKLTQDDIGLAFEVTLPNTSLGQDTYENVRLGNLRGCSFGFIARNDIWQQDVSGNLTRIIDDIQCFEVTLTAFPAYPATAVDVDLRSVRAKLAKGNVKVKRDDDNLDLDDQEDPEGCDCDCEACEQGNCENCSSEGCYDDDCENCPNQTRSAHLEILKRRLR